MCCAVMRIYVSSSLCCARVQLSLGYSKWDISFRRGGKNCSLAMKIHHFKGLIYFLYSAILVLGAFLQHISSLQTPVSLWLIYNNITICTSSHLLHQAMKLNYQVEKESGKSQNNDVEQVSGCQWSCHSYCCVRLERLGTLGAAHSQPTQGTQGSGIYTPFIEVKGLRLNLSFPHLLILPQIMLLM